MKKKCIVITLISFTVLFLLACALPDKITVNAGLGKRMEVSVYFLLLLSPIPALYYWSHTRKRGVKEDEQKHS